MLVVPGMETSSPVLEASFVRPAIEYDLESPNICVWVVLVRPMAVRNCVAEDHLAVLQKVDLAVPLRLVGANPCPEQKTQRR